MADTKRRNDANIEQEAHDSGLVSDEKNKIFEEHARKYPEGDPAVRRIRPDRGEIPITEPQGDGTMKVIPPEKRRKAS
jgi:hypothetical protein